MIKVFLVEDEYAIREGIKKSVNWEANGYTLVGEAGDGEMAFPKIVKAKPDILITDIRMPFMDGLELSRLVKKEIPNIKIVVLSGYDDFNYAKQAISIGVEEYILKPVSGETLLAELGKIADTINAQRQENQAKEKYLRDMEEIRTLAKQKFIHDTIDGKLSMQESLEQGRDLGIDITATYYSIVLFQAFPRSKSSAAGGAEFDVAEYSGISEEIYSSIKDAFSDSKDVYLYEQVGDVLCFLGKSDSLDEMTRNSEKGMNSIKDIMSTYPDWIYFISVGKPVERIRDVNSSYRDASRKFAERYMLDDSFIFYGEDGDNREKIREKVSAEKKDSTDTLVDINSLDINTLDIGGIDIKMVSQKTIFHFLRNGTLGEIDDLVDEYFTSLGDEALESLMLRQYVLMEALISGMAFLDSMNVSKEKSSEILGELTDPVKFVDSVDKAKDYITRILRSLIDYRNQVSDKKYTEIIDKAREFIQDNYKNDEMSLQTVASYVNVSSNHFSAIFRRETGETFIDYLTRVRMDNAKDLLTCTSMKTSEIGFEVGYKDPHYFSYIFKKTIGMSPKEYRRMKKDS